MKKNLLSLCTALFLSLIPLSAHADNPPGLNKAQQVLYSAASTIDTINLMEESLEFQEFMAHTVFARYGEQYGKFPTRQSIKDFMARDHYLMIENLNECSAKLTGTTPSASVLAWVAKYNKTDAIHEQLRLSRQLMAATGASSALRPMTVYDLENAVASRKGFEEIYATRYLPNFEQYKTMDFCTVENMTWQES